MDAWAWLESLPPITRTWFCASVLVNVGTSADMLAPQDLVFDPQRIYQNLELWRILTSFLYGGGNLNEFHVLLGLYMITMHSTSYEKNPHYAGGNPRADYAFCLMVCTVTTLVTYLLLDYFYMYYYDYGHHQRLLHPVFSGTLLTSIIYLWSRRNPNANIQLNFVPIQGRYLPFAHLVLALALGNPVWELLHGMLVGHIYFYLVQVVPTVLGRRVLTTPSILVEVVTDVFGAQPEFRQDVVPQQNEEERRRPQTNHNNRFLQEGATDAHVAAKIGNLETLQSLSQTAEGRQSFGAKDNNDWQPLHEAVRGGFINVVNFLLEFDSVDKNARTLQGRGPSPLWVAETTHGIDHPVTKRLRELGAEKIGPE